MLKGTALISLALMAGGAASYGQASSAGTQPPIYVDGWDYEHAKTGWNIYAVSPSGTALIAGTDANEMFPFLVGGESTVGFMVEKKGSESRQIMRQPAGGGASELGVTITTSTICATSPNGHQLVCPDDTGETRQLFIIDTETKQRRQITESARNNSLDPSWSPDGKSIAYFTGPDRDLIGGEQKPKGDHLVIYDVAARTSRLLTNGMKGADQTPRWSPDGKWLAFHRQTKNYGWNIWIVQADGTGEIQLTTSKQEETYPTWSPDGKQIAFQCYQSKPDTFDICVVDVATKQVKQLTDTPKLDERHPVWGR